MALYGVPNSFAHREGQLGRVVIGKIISPVCVKDNRLSLDPLTTANCHVKDVAPTQSIPPGQHKLHGDRRATFAAASGQDGPPGSSSHTQPEPVLLMATAIIGLICALHECLLVLPVSMTVLLHRHDEGF